MVNDRRLPTFFLTHGGGPLPLLGDPSHAALIKHWKQLRTEIAQDLKPRIKAVVLVSAHWEAEGGPTVTSWEGPQDLVFDYYGFPPESYKYSYPAKGSPQLAQRIVSLFRERGMHAKTDASRGFDHAAFVPLLGLMPEADIPVLAVSVISNMDPKAHIEMGKALAPLRDEGVLILGSGSSFHSIRAMMSGSGEVEKAQEFDNYLQDAVTASPAEREANFESWLSAPHARYCHPREDHLVPLFVAAGAAPDGKGSVIFSDSLMGLPISSFKFE